jgi:glutaryl-CoA dehydrogenase
MYTGIGRSLGTDYFRIADQLTGEELSYLRRTRDFVDNDVRPAINGCWERAEFPWPLIEKLAKLGVAGDGIDGPDYPPMSPIVAGLVHWSSAGCPAWRRRKKLGAFALTEPMHGSDSVALETSARRDGGEWVIEGQDKRFLVEKGTQATTRGRSTARGRCAGVAGRDHVVRRAGA